MNFDLNKVFQEKKDEIIKTIEEFVALESYYDESTVSESKPFGAKISNVFDLVKQKCKEDNITCRDVDGYALEITLGDKTEEDFGILAHLDTVPVQLNWDTDPFTLTKIDNWYYGLGASDDKGPSAIIYVLIKYLNSLSLTFKRQLKVVLGGAEERGFQCLFHYFDKNPQMTYGVSPDANFPVINFEKSAWNFNISKTFDLNTKGDVNVVSINAGTALNVVPQFANAKFELSDNVKDEFISKLEASAAKFEVNGNIVDVVVEGVPSHGMEPHKGVNALYKLVNIIKGFNLDANFASFLADFDKYLLDDVNGKKLGVYAENQFGNTTNNLGVFKYENNAVEFLCNIRFTNDFEFEDVDSKVKEAFASYKISTYGKNYHYIPEDAFIYKQTKLAYESATGNEFKSMATGGGTYARMLKNGLAFGPNVDYDTNMHQKNERISEDNIEATFKTYLQLINNICIEN